MIKEFFEDINKQEELKKILDSWIGTPFRHYCGVKGLGCDCIHFVACVFDEMKIIKMTKKLIPDYPKDWHLHNTRELLKEGIVKNLKTLGIGLGSLKNGDIILSHYGKAASHIGIYLDGYVYQALEKIGVCKINIKDKKFKERMRFAMRVLI